MKFDKIALPMVRRVFPSTFANDLVKVQPMSSPNGLSHSLKMQYEAWNPFPEFDKLCEREGKSLGEILNEIYKQRIFK
jgi:hypothetical protein